MKVLDKVATKTEMQYIMLTVFNANAKAKSFYELQGFSVDEISPQNENYQIMTRPVLPTRNDTTKHAHEQQQQTELDQTLVLST